MKLDRQNQPSITAPQRFLTPIQPSRLQESASLRTAARADVYTEASSFHEQQTLSVSGGATGHAEGWRAAAGLLSNAPGASLSIPDLGRRIERLDSALGGLQHPAVQILGGAIGEMRKLGLESAGSAKLILAHPGRADAVERSLIETLASPASGAAHMAGETQKILAELLSVVQGRPGLSPHGFEPGAFGLPAEAPRPQAPSSAPQATAPAQASAPVQASAPAPASAPAQPAAQPSAADVKARSDQAAKLVESGTLGSKPAGPKPPASKEELQKLNGRINAANDDAAVKIAADPRALELATPEQKARLVKKLMDGHTNASEEQAIKKIMLSCKSKDEFDQVVQGAGGWKEFKSELDDKDLKQVQAHADSLGKKQDASVKQAITLLEQAQSPEEFKKLADQLGADQLKHALPKPSINILDPKGMVEAQKAHENTLGRLEALAKKHGMPSIGYGMNPAKAVALQGEVSKAINKENNDAITQLSENSEAMKAASPQQKARMIEILQSGWTKDRHDMAISRILTSCSSKAEFDKVVNMAGGPKILDDVDYDQAKADINKLAGGWNRTDIADDKPLARKYQGIYADPAKNAALTKTRPPSDAELREVMGKGPFSPEDLKNPALAHVSQAFDSLRTEMGKVAHDLDQDPMARNKLAMVNRDRQIKGQPPLDYTSLVTQAYKTANDPSFKQEVERRVAEKQAKMPVKGMKLDEKDVQEIREEVLGEKLGAVAKQYGLSEQDMKTMVTAKMGRVLGEGAGAVRQYSGEMAKSMQSELWKLERTRGPNCPEAQTLREALAKLGPATEGYADGLEKTGATAANLFKVPPSFAETFVKVISVVGDIAAALVNVIPGVGQAISGAYFGTKAIIAAVQGDVLGMFTSIASALPGVGGAIGGAVGQAISMGGRLVQAGIGVGQGISQGNVMGVLGGLASAAGGLGGVGGAVGNVANTAQKALQAGSAAAGLIDGAVRGDISQALSGLSGMAGGLSGSLGSVGQSLAKGLDLVSRGAGVAQALSKGDFGSAVSGALGGLGGALGTPALREAAGYAQKAAPLIDALGKGDLAASLGAAAGLLPEGMGGGVLGRATRFAEDVAAGRMGDALGGLSQGLRELGMPGVGLDSVQKLLGSKTLGDAIGIARGGADFFGGLASGELTKSLGGLADTQGLTQMLDAAAPFARAAVSGGLEPLGSALAKAAPEVADALGGLGELASGGLARSIEAGKSALGELTRPLRQAQAKPWLDALDQAQARLAADRTLGLPDSLRRLGAAPLAGRLEQFGASPEARALGGMSAQAGRFLEALGQRSPEAVGDALRQWMPELKSGGMSSQLAGLEARAQELLASEAMAFAQPEAAEARQALEQAVRASGRRAEIRAFEEAARQMSERWPTDWTGMGAELLGKLGLGA